MTTAVKKYIAFSIFVSGLISVGCTNDSVQDTNVGNKETVSDPAVERDVPIKVSLVIRDQYRNDAGVEEVTKILQSQGITVTGSGLATVSGRASSVLLQEVFALTQVQVSQLEASRAISKNQVYIDPPELLSKYCQSISIEPVAEYMNQ